MDDLALVAKLDVTLKETIKGLNALESRENGLKHRVEALESKKSILEKDNLALEEKRSRLDSLIYEETKGKHEEIEKKLNEASKREIELTNLMAISQRKSIEFDSSKESMEKAKVEYERLLAEYTEKSNQLTEKQNRLTVAFNG